MSQLDTTAARAAAAATFKASLGLPASPLAWTYEQRIAYNKALAAYIQANPAQFSPVDLNTAQIVAAKSYSGLDEASFSWGDFGAEIVNQSEEINPFSQRNRTQSKYVLVAVLAVVGLALVAWLTGQNPLRSSAAK